MFRGRTNILVKTQFNLKEKLARRVQRLVNESFNTYHSTLQQFMGFVHKQSTIMGIVEALSQKWPDAEEYARTVITSDEEVLVNDENALEPNDQDHWLAHDGVAATGHRFADRRGARPDRCGRLGDCRPAAVGTAESGPCERHGPGARGGGDQQPVWLGPTHQEARDPVDTRNAVWGQRRYLRAHGTCTRDSGFTASTDRGILRVIAADCAAHVMAEHP